MNPNPSPRPGTPNAFSRSLEAAIDVVHGSTSNRARRTERIAALFARLGFGTIEEPEGSDTPKVPIPVDMSTQCAARGVTLPTFTGGTVEDAYAWAASVARAWGLVTAYGQLTRAPHPVAGALLDARAGRLAIDTKPTLTLDARRQTFRPPQPRDRSGKTFGAAKLDTQYWDLVTVRGLYRSPTSDAERARSHVQMALALERGVRPDADNTGVLVRAKLTPGMLRAWLAAWWLSDRWDQTHDKQGGLGLFALDTRAVLYELYGLKPSTRTVKGKTYQRPPVSAERSLMEHFQGLQEIFLRGIGMGTQRIEPQDPERVLTYIEDASDRRRIYRHATLAVIMMRNAFLQIPTAALRLDPEDTPLALGISALWRDRIARHVLRGEGHYQTTLRALAEQSGEDCKAGARNDGRAYWTRLTKRLERVMGQGELGHLHVTGEGPTATVTLTPSDILATVYSSLNQAPKTTPPRLPRSRSKT